MSKTLQDLNNEIENLKATVARFTGGPATSEVDYSQQVADIQEVETLLSAPTSGGTPVLPPVTPTQPAVPTTPVTSIPGQTDVPTTPTSSTPAPGLPVTGPTGPTTADTTTPASTIPEG